MKRISLLVTVAVMVAAALALSGVAAWAAPGGNAANAQKCEEGGYLNYTDAQGNAFKNEGQCTRYAARGGELVPVPTPDISINETREGEGIGKISGTGFTPNSLITITNVYTPNGQTFIHTGVSTDATGAFVTPFEVAFCFEDTNTSVEVTATDAEGVTVTESFPLNCGV